jgi:hypothetical protein
MQDLKRIQDAAKNYSGLQGLRIIPIGLLFLVFPLQRLNLPILGGQGNCTVTLPLLLVAILGWFWIGHYYEAHFGKVEPLVSPRAITYPVLAFLIIFIAWVFLENILYRAHFGPPFNIIGLSVGIAGLYAGIRTRRWYYTLSGALLGIAIFLPIILAAGSADPVYGEFGVLFTLLFGLSIIFVGVLDHLRLVRYFTPKGARADARNS